ncbi:MAG: hypothetical protein HOK80_09550 [Candidatus Cloacimonetes bacterium]|jgi:hypothetical protein|nr:hypothetical protein [Candidatus Cloacimonadota bacterium]MBT4332343.1 hypothetical protein [Candidatus Cloacimonadota bacterium]MBT4575594.1 hypothetical protein [Candidatus Cloacimonadota bacterium]MBT5421125.1 hypothetical protein [Candidatus Cloacimonadota bacterium]
MNKLHLLLILVIIFCFSCDTTSPEELDKNAILDILDSIQTNFNFDDLNGIMQNYHQLFNHNGYSYGSESIRWEIRLNDFNEMTFDNIDIVINGDFATASFVMHLDNTSLNEPSDENGDLSYFYYDYGSWKLCGEDFVILP